MSKADACSLVREKVEVDDGPLVVGGPGAVRGVNNRHGRSVGVPVAEQAVVEVARQVKHVTGYDCH